MLKLISTTKIASTVVEMVLCQGPISKHEYLYPFSMPVLYLTAAMQMVLIYNKCIYLSLVIIKLTTILYETGLANKSVKEQEYFCTLPIFLESRS